MSKREKDISNVEPLLIRASQAAIICNVSRTAWYRFVGSGLAPKPIKIGTCSVWSLSRLKQWIELNCPNAEMFERMVKIKKLNSYFSRTRSVGKPLRKRYLDQRNKTKAIRQLSNNYVKQVVCDNTNLRHSDIPEELIATKREQIKLKRLIKEDSA